MNFFVKYLLPGFAVTALVFSTCDKSNNKAREKTGKAGDHFDLFAVMNVVKTSSTPEALEKSLNSQSTGVNNLDLDEDGNTDYIKVTDKKIDESSHALVLQVDVASGKTQDVAVIEIQKSGDKEAYIQIIGDEDLYGDDYIVEPKSEKAEAALVVATTLAVNVWSWPLVTYIYSPAYVVYTSPYRYEYYPVWWEPWPVVVYDVYYPTVSVYRTHYVISDGYRFVNIHENYHSHYRVTTKFNYHEKNHGFVKADGKEKPGKDFDRTGNKNNNVGKSDQNKNTGGGKHDNKSVQPVKDDKPGKDVNKKDGGRNDVYKNTSNKGKENVAPKSPSKSKSQPKQPKSGSGAKGGGGKGGDKGHK